MGQVAALRNGIKNGSRGISCQTSRKTHILPRKSKVLAPENERGTVNQRSFILLVLRHIFPSRPIIAEGAAQGTGL